MKVGDVVKALAYASCPIGIVIEIDDHCGWPHVMIEEGRIVVWPKEQLEVISESR